MNESFHAVYRNGAFVPLVPCDLPEGTPVEVKVRDRPNILPPLEADPQKREKIKQQLLDRMSNSPLPADAPKLTREQLHERR